MYLHNTITPFIRKISSLHLVAELCGTLRGLWDGRQNGREHADGRAGQVPGRELQHLVAHGHSGSGCRIVGSMWKEHAEDTGLWTCVCFQVLAC